MYSFPCYIHQNRTSEIFFISHLLEISHTLVWLSINTLRPRQNGPHFADDICECIFLNKNVWIPIKTSLKFVPKGQINKYPALVQMMTWRRPGDKPSSEPMMVSLPTHICVIRPQWVYNAANFSLQWFHASHTRTWTSLSLHLAITLKQYQITLKPWTCTNIPSNYFIMKTYTLVVNTDNYIVFIICIALTCQQHNIIRALNVLSQSTFGWPANNWTIMLVDLREV